MAVSVSNSKPAAALAFAAAALAACSTAPIGLSSQFDPPSRASYASGKPPALPAELCRVQIAHFTDMRPDSQTMGAMGAHTVQADTGAWVRSGLESLARDSRIRFVGTASEADLSIDVELLKAYVMTITVDKASNVALRIRYSRNGAPQGDALYRGTDTDVNWANGDGETQETLNRALANLLEDVDRDLLARCKG